LNQHLKTNEKKFHERKDQVAKMIFSKTVEIDEKGTAVIEESDLAEYCEGLASIFDEEDDGLAKKLEEEIHQQKTKFGSGTLQPLVKTNIVGAEKEGAFSVVQVCATWNKDEITVNYSQMGRSWKVPDGEPTPDIEVMLDYYQYKAVGTMLEALGVEVPSATTSGSKPEVSHVGLAQVSSDPNETCSVPAVVVSAPPVVTIDGSCPEQPRLKRTAQHGTACKLALRSPQHPESEGSAKSGITTELLLKAAAAIEAALLGGNGDDDHRACEFSVAEFQEVEVVFNNCIEMRAGHIPASAAGHLLDGLGFSARRLAVVETSLAQAEAAGAFLDLREFSRLVLLLRDAASPNSESALSGSPASGSPVSGSQRSPLFGSPAKALRRSRSHGSLAREFAEPKPHGRVASLRAPLEPLPQMLRCTGRSSGRRQLRRCSSVCHFDQMRAPASFQSISQRILS
jgi:hypothetical protein